MAKKKRTKRRRVGVRGDSLVGMVRRGEVGFPIRRGESIEEVLTRHLDNANRGRGWHRESRRHREAALKAERRKRASGNARVYESPEEITRLVGRDGWYPQGGEPMIREGFRFDPRTIEVLQEFKWRMPWTGSYEERTAKARWLIEQLCRIYNMPPVTVRATGVETTNACYNRADNSITMNKLSVITLLHEFGHAKGYNERWTTFWSNNLFKQMFPRNWAKLRHAEGGTSHVMVCEPVPEEEWRQTINGAIHDNSFGDEPVVIAAPHDVISGSGLSGDKHTGAIARKLAEAVHGKVLVFTNYVRRDVNVNHPKYTCERQVLSTPRGEMVYTAYIRAIAGLGANQTTHKLVEIHGYVGEGRKVMVATNRVSRGEAERIKALSDANVIFVVDQLENIPMPANTAKTYGALGQYKSLHIEIPKGMREHPDALIPKLKQVVEAIR